ncbi:hypothetical protein NTG1052_560059 [Candidatus Nitrotoga sp. 1052]|nr:hypothetical protein NTG1052_560059 [Candidatus Nitrotoga sp. 1052]
MEVEQVIKGGAQIGRRVSESTVEIEQDGASHDNRRAGN